MRRISALAAIALLLSLQVFPLRTDPGEIKLSKFESIYYKLLPDGTISDGDAEVTIRVENPSEEEKVITIVDRVSKAHIESFNVLAGTPEPSTKEIFFDNMICIWKDLLIPPASDVELRYTVSTYKPPPIAVNISYYVNGEEVQPIELEGDYYIMINSGDILTINLTVRNLREPKYVRGEVLRPPLPYSIEMRIPKNNFLEPESCPEPYMLYSLSEDWSITWIGVLEEDTLNISLSAKVRTTEHVGEVELKSVRVQLQLDASSMAEELEEVLKSYNSSLNELNNMRDSLTNMKDLMSKFLEGIVESEEKMEEASTQLLELSKALRNASVSIETARVPLRNVISMLEELESNLTEAISMIRRIESGRNISIPNLTIPIPPPNISLSAELSKILSRLTSTKSTLLFMDQSLENMQISLSTAADYAYNSSLAIGELKDAMKSLEFITSASLSMMDSYIEEVDSRISDLTSQMEDLSRKIQLTRFKEPFLGNIEVRNSDCPSFEVRAELSKVSDGSWAIHSLDLEGPELNVSEVALQVICEYGDAAKTPPEEAVRVQVLEGDEWVDVDGRALGVTYDEELGVILYRPGNQLKNGSNPLIDQMENEFRIIVDSNLKPDVICKVDPICGISAEPKVRMVTRVDNPYLALNMNLTEEYSEEKFPPPEETPQERRGVPYFVFFFVGSIGLIIPFVVLKIRMDREMRSQLYKTLDELEQELNQLKSLIKEKKSEQG